MKVLGYLWLLLLAGITLGCLQVSIVAPWETISSDSAVYVERARAIAAGESLGAKDTFFPMGISYLFALFFWLFGEDRALPLLACFQMLVIVGCHVMTYMNARLLFDDEWVARLAGIISVAYWPITGQVSFFMSEPAFMFALLVGQWFMIKAAQTSSWTTAVLAGVAIGLAATIKTQGLIVLIAGLMLLPFVPGRRFLGGVVLGTFVVLMIYGSHLAKVSGEDGWKLSGNGAFNVYLGQSARIGVGTSDPHTGVFTHFYNNNSYMGKGLLQPRTFNVSVDDSDFFLGKTVELIRDNPLRQLFRSLQSGFELFAPVPHWPLRMLGDAAAVEKVFKYLVIPLVYFPALIAVFAAVRTRRHSVPVFMMGLPVVGIFLVACMSMGQPRYLIPYLPNLFILGAFGWRLVRDLLRGCTQASPDTE